MPASSTRWDRLRMVSSLKWSPAIFDRLRPCPLGQLYLLGLVARDAVSAGDTLQSGFVGCTIPENPKAIDFHLNDIARLQPDNAACRTRCNNIFRLEASEGRTIFHL